MLEEYTLEEPKQQGRSPDSLIQAIDRIERLEKQLAIAKEALEVYHKGQIYDVQEVDGEDCVYNYPYSNDDGETAEQALKQIKELEK